MRTTILISFVATVVLTGTAAGTLRAADTNVPPARPKDLDEFREQIKKLPPEERATKIKEYREKHPGLTNRLDSDKRREEWNSLPLEEREARMKAWRERWRTNHPGMEKMKPEEREAKRKELRENLEKQISALRQKKADGTITPQEEKQLDRLEEILKRFDKQGPPGSTPGAPGKPETPALDKPAQPPAAK